MSYKNLLNIDIRSGREDILTEIIRLNADAEQETSTLTQARLDAMLTQAIFAQASVNPSGTPVAFLIAFDQDAAYESPNFLWFRARLPRFAYIDRVIVAPAARGQGIARALYGNFFDRAKALDLPFAVCEVNAVPPNPASDAFHASLGFTPLGLGLLPGGKQVRHLHYPLGTEEAIGTLL